MRGPSMPPTVERRWASALTQAHTLLLALAETEEEVAAKAAREAEKEALLNQKKADEKNGWEKRYDRTKEDFRAKEKRKRSMGQQSSTGDWVQEEKRRLRHGATGNYDS